MPSHEAFEVLQANGYIHATSVWNPEDQVPPRFTGKFPLPDPRSHKSNPKLFIFAEPLALRSERAPTRQAPDAHEDFTPSPSSPSGGHGISIRGQSRLNSVPTSYSGGLDFDPEGYSARDRTYFSSHNPAPDYHGSGFTSDLEGHSADRKSVV